MNQKRRAEIAKARAILENVLSEEEMAFDSMPENLQGSLRGTEMEENIDILNEIIDQLDEIS